VGHLQRVVAISIVVIAMAAVSGAPADADTLTVSPYPVVAGGTVTVRGSDPRCAPGYNWRFIYVASQDTIAFGTNDSSGSIEFSAEVEARFAGEWQAEIRCPQHLVITANFTVYRDAPVTPPPTSGPRTTAAPTTAPSPPPPTAPITPVDPATPVAALVEPAFVG